MANLQVKNVPLGLHRKLQLHAKRLGRTMRDVVLDAVAKEIERQEFRARLEKRDRVELGRPLAKSLEESRAQRERELGK